VKFIARRTMRGADSGLFNTECTEEEHRGHKVGFPGNECKLMRIRAIVFLCAGILISIFYARALAEIRKGPFGDEFGSVTYPVPPQLKAVGISGVLCFVIGLCLLIFDLRKRWRQEPHD
jgi:hypothetical protein